MDTDTRESLVSGAWRDEIAAEAHTWLDTPYMPKARLKSVACDCGGLIYELYNPWFGPFEPFPMNYSGDWALHEANPELYLNFIMPYVVACDAPRKGGLSLFHIGLRYAHAAIYVGDDQFIHAWGRARLGSVAKTPGRVMRFYGKSHPVRHFDPVVRL